MNEQLFESIFNAFSKDKPYQKNMEDQIHSWWLFHYKGSSEIVPLVKKFYKIDMTEREVEEILSKQREKFRKDIEEANSKSRSL
jgi:hypothetical protein